MINYKKDKYVLWEEFGEIEFKLFLGKEIEIKCVFDGIIKLRLIKRI